MLTGQQSCLENFRISNCAHLLIISTNRRLGQASWARRAGHWDSLFRLKSLTKNLPYVVDKDKLNVFEEVLGHFIEVALILRRQDDLGNPSAAGGQHLLFYTSYGKNVSAQSNFASHGDVFSHGSLRQGRNQSCRQSDAR